MIIIKSQAEIRLIQALEAIKAAPGTRRSIWVSLSSVPELTPHQLAAVITDISRFITSDDCQLYQLFNHDICIMGNGLTHDQKQLVHDSVSRTLGVALPESVVKLYDLNLDWGRIAVLAEGILQEKRAIAIRQQQEMLQRRRDEILNVSIPPATREKMQQTRRNRQALEVMVVEDDAFSRQIVCNSLRKIHAVSAVGDGKSALANYFLKAPDVLFLDIDLPDVSGHDVLNKITNADPDAYIIMLSGNGDKENVMRAIQAGAKGFVGKPFAKEKLIQYIERSPAFQKKLPA